MKKTTALIIVVVFVLAFAAPAFAQQMTHNVEYKMNGTIDLKKQVGHICNTGAEFKQTITGEGEMTKVTDTTQVAGKITVSDSQDWVTAEDATRNLTVTSVIELCAPAKSEFGSLNLLPYIIAADDELEEGTTWEDLEGGSWAAYKDYQDFLNAHEGAVLPPAILYELLKGQSRAGLLASELGIDLADYVKPLTDQIWAVQVSADPGFSGALSQDFEAAYGPWADAHGYLGNSDEPDDAWWFVDDDGNQVSDYLTLQPSFGINGIDGFSVGKDYVGNYFNIDQFARTSQGTTKRYISISSPWSHAYLMEDMEVVGMAEITESFSMDNIAPGAEAVTNWWELF